MVKVTYKSFPQAVETTAQAVTAFDDYVLGPTVTFLDTITGQIFSRRWNSYSKDEQNLIKGSAIAAGASVSFVSLYSVATKEIFKIARNISVDVAKRTAKDSTGYKGVQGTLSTLKLTTQKARELSIAGKMIDTADRGGELTKAGRALQKHGGREGSAFPPAKGNPAAINEQGQKILEDIVYDPKHEIKHGNRFDGFDIFDSQGRGARFDANRNFRGFLEPKQ